VVEVARKLRASSPMHCKSMFCKSIEFTTHHELSGASTEFSGLMNSTHILLEFSNIPIKAHKPFVLSSQTINYFSKILSNKSHRSNM
jgi:hypothetical protein